jgi:hypothetical protein
MLPHPQSAVTSRSQRLVDLSKVYFFCEKAKIATINEAKLNITIKLSYIVNKHHPLSKGACLI